MNWSKRSGAAAQSRFKGRVLEWARRLRVKPKQIRVQRMQRKWASCSSAGRITFAAALLHEPPAFQQYVIVHELLHLRVANHGRLFKKYLSAYVPKWKRFAT